MDKGKVIDLLSGRDGVEVKHFLEAHKEVEFVCRDRSSAYSAAVNEVLPKAEQIADRFHLVQNLSDVVYEVIRAEYPKFVQLLKKSETQLTESAKELHSPGPAERIKREPSAWRKQVFSDVKKMIREGGYKTIARQLKMSRTTVRNYAALDSLAAKSVSLRNDYNNYLKHIEQGLSGEETLKAIYQSIISCGFKGSYSAFAAQFKDHPHSILIARVILLQHQMLLTKYPYYLPEKFRSIFHYQNLPGYKVKERKHK